MILSCVNSFSFKGMTMLITSAITVIRGRMILGPLLLAFVLAACGGGGGSSGMPAPVTTRRPTFNILLRRPLSSARLSQR